MGNKDVFLKIPKSDGGTCDFSVRVAGMFLNRDRNATISLI